MLAFLEQPDLRELGDRLRAAHAVTAGLMSEIIGEACRRCPSMGQTEKTARIERLLQSEAWTDAALALIDLELPQWRLRRIAFDEGEWHCALSRRARIAGLARPVDRGPSHRSAVGDPRCLCRRPSDDIAGAQGECSRRAIYSKRFLRTGLLRRFFLNRERRFPEFRVLAQLRKSVARIEIGPGARSLLPANGHSGRFRPRSAASASSDRRLRRCCGWPSSSAPSSA